MKTSIFSIAFAAGLAAAQLSLEEVPDCAVRHSHPYPFPAALTPRAAESPPHPPCEAPGQLTDIKSQGPCITEYVTGNKIAGCGQYDIECVCSNEEFIDGIACCVDEACDAKGKEATLKFAAQICSTQNVEVPDKVECKSKTTSATSTSSPSETDEADAAAETEDEDDAAPASLSGMTGVIGAAVAMLFAL
ncbi:hypothetical protein ACRE_019060 [Hapsidospora chrysogenum ATCC 11550]|uniref:CFEM domain-containing protein n=1 Tax=Hapsidospora chrysogenum (strain ATCC 11550 / CBS 779.69 / DSM 880 / IAM 14645 / JCM 23072 / IMI 49137) TaxID=857340 RepID=A0A086TD55_HAPC1|nr:hypothetical protein ACRE_019060 [Hapsidospora chrysogenum ATCC 11550]